MVSSNYEFIFVFYAATMPTTTGFLGHSFGPLVLGPSLARSQKLTKCDRTRTMHLQCWEAASRSQFFAFGGGLLLMPYFAWDFFLQAAMIKSLLHAAFWAFCILHSAFLRPSCIFQSRLGDSSTKEKFMLFENLLKYDNHNAGHIPAIFPPSTINMRFPEKIPSQRIAANNNKQVGFQSTGLVNSPPKVKKCIKFVNKPKKKKRKKMKISGKA